jgi:hypothetical protein
MGSADAANQFDNFTITAPSRWADPTSVRAVQPLPGDSFKIVDKITAGAFPARSRAT